MNDLNRNLSVYADDEPVNGFRHAYLSGRDAVGLLPLPFLLRIWNPDESAYLLLCSAKDVAVMSDDSVLAFGKVSAVYRRTVPEGIACEIIFSPGLKLWDAQVSLSVEAGVSVSETVRRILAASGTGIPLLSWPGEDPVRSRGQAFFGRAAECVNEALSATGAKACLNRSGLCVLPAADAPVTLVLSEADLIDAPVTVNNLIVLRTRVVGWPLGKKASIRWKGQSWEGVVTERAVEADNMDGDWQCELALKI